MNSSIQNSKEKITKKKLLEFERQPKTDLDKLKEYLICLAPIFFGFLALFEYLYIPNYGGSESTYTYAIFLGLIISCILVLFIVGLLKKKRLCKLLYKAPFYSLVFVLLLFYDYLTLKTGKLILPYFSPIDNILNSMIEDRKYLFECTINSLILLFTGYFYGLIVGIISGIACGYSKKVNYWIEPFMKLLGAIPTTTWIPVVLVLADSLFKGSVFIIALGVWFSITLSTITGIKNIDKSYYEAARTLGAKDIQLITNIAIPSAIPSIFQGMLQAMSSACTALLVAEMIGVESGLGWYIVWQKSWAEYGKMYGAIILICLVFILVNIVLNTLKNKVLRWQEGMVK